MRSLLALVIGAFVIAFSDEQVIKSLNYFFRLPVGLLLPVVGRHLVVVLGADQGVGRLGHAILPLACSRGLRR